MKVFLDSSALVKRYIEEPGSDRVAVICAAAEELAVSVVCVTEVLSACNRLLREKKITAKQYAWIKNEFLLDIAEFFVIELTAEVVGRSVTCLEKGAVRSLDALHIASALESGCTRFVTGDERQRGVAGKMGLKDEFV